LMGILVIVAGEPARKPIDPLTLRWLYVNAELVVVAKPGRTKVLERSKDHQYSASVPLSIEQTLKGDAKGTSITVFFGPTVDCPLPDRYPEDKTVLAFLDWDRTVSAYHARGFSYGSKELAPEDLKVYLARLEELAKIPEKEQQNPQCPEMVEWLVKCMEHPATRWEGAFEFDVVGHRGRRRSEIRSKLVPTSKLSPELLKRLVEALLKTREVSKGDLELASVLRDVADPRIDTLLVRRIRESIDLGDSWQGESIAWVIADRLKSDKASILLKRLYDLDRNEDNQTRITVLVEFLTLVRE
jgi:hypothetical protein